MPRKELVEPYLVVYAVGALMSFCKRHGESEIDRHSAIVEFGIAFREGEGFEWTPCGKEFRRILAISPNPSSGHVAIVFGYDGIDPKLTKELNDDIFNATRGALGGKTKNVDGTTVSTGHP